MSESEIELFVDGQRLTLPSDLSVAEAANRALGALGRAAGRMDRLILARESGESLDEDATLGNVCVPGEQLKLVPAQDDA
jgi:hypothetical protein